MLVELGMGLRGSAFVFLITWSKRVMSDDKVYHGNIDLTVANNSHTKIIMRILEDGDAQGKRVLDIGCSQGYLGYALKAFGLEVCGVEPSAQAATVAGTRIDHVYHCTLAAFLTEHAPHVGKFDYLIFGDVLEHLIDPETTLLQCHHLLLPDGAVIASIPNIAHMATRLMLLGGRWDYADFGLMDRTHLRFFTRSTLVDLFTSSSYRIESIDRVNLEVDATGIFVEPDLQDWAKRHIHDPDAETFQYVVMARNCSAGMSEDDRAANTIFSLMPRARVLVLVPFFDLGLATIRVVQPLSTWMRRYGGHVHFMKFADLQMVDLQNIDLVVVQRVISPLVLKLIQKMQARGIRVIFDIDDLLTEMPSYLASSTAVGQQYSILEKILRRVDAISVSTSRLGDQLSKYNQCHLTPNCPAPLLNPVSRTSQQGVITLLIASSDTVRFDFVVSALRQLLAHFPSQLRLIAIGPPGDFLLSQGFAVEKYSAMDYLEFRRFISSQTDAIGIIPLDATKFGACKSAIKFMDYALAGIPSVCSAVAPYIDVVRDGENGLLAKNTCKDWYDAVAKLCSSADTRHAMADLARREVQSDWSLTRSADAWNSVIEAHLGKRVSADTLDSALSRTKSLPRIRHYVRRLMALHWAMDMEGGLLPFFRRINHLRQTEGTIGLRRRLSAFRSREY
jgi:2-polyprenyl-3-methyl-5-hydroxy-6-metoxy-1,4-benzoquinol methylase/glycosyltransferase involved in cell wall biosynthesis